MTDLFVWSDDPLIFAAALWKNKRTEKNARQMDEYYQVTRNQLEAQYEAFAAYTTLMYNDFAGCIDSAFPSMTNEGANTVTYYVNAYITADRARLMAQAQDIYTRFLGWLDSLNPIMSISVIKQKFDAYIQADRKSTAVAQNISALDTWYSVNIPS